MIFPFSFSFFFRDRITKKCHFFNQFFKKKIICSVCEIKGERFSYEFFEKQKKKKKQFFNNVTLHYSLHCPFFQLNIVLFLFLFLFYPENFWNKIFFICILNMKNPQIYQYFWEQETQNFGTILNHRNIN